MGRSYGSCDYECVRAVETAIGASTSGRPAAMFVEPIQGNGGVCVAAPEYFPRLRDVLDKYDTLLVADEVQTSFGRTGEMFAMDHWGIEPDIVVGGKALSGGTPIGFVSTTDEIAASYARPGASTFGGNPVTAAAALTFMEILRRDGLVCRAAKLGHWLRRCLAELADKHEMIGEVRGLGLMLTVSNPLPHNLPTGDYGVRVVTVKVDALDARRKAAPVGQWELTRSGGGAIPANGSRRWTLAVPASARTIRIDLIRRGHGGAKAATLLRKEVRPP